MPSSSDNRRAWLVGRPILAAAAASTVLVGFAAAPASAASQPSCGSTVTTSITLQADITGCPGDGLVIGASGITIDLNGHLLSGTGSEVSGSGIRSPEASQVTIKHGRIENFSGGVDLTRTLDSVVTGVQFAGNDFGVILRQSRVTVTNNFMVGTRNTSDFGVFVVSGQGNRVTSNTLKGFDGAGIAVSSQASSTTVAGNNTSNRSGDGIWMGGQQTTVYGNTVVANGYEGIVVKPGATGSVRSNTVTQSASRGIDVPATSGSVVVANNTANYNQEQGIWAESAGHDGGGNHATGNDITPQCLNVVCS